MKNENKKLVPYLMSGEYACEHEDCPVVQTGYENRDTLYVSDMDRHGLYCIDHISQHMKKGMKSENIEIILTALMNYRSEIRDNDMDDEKTISEWDKKIAFIDETYELVRQLETEKDNEESMHNGWTSYATWLVNLEIVENFGYGDFEKKFDNLYDLAIDIKNQVKGILNSECSVEYLSNGYALAFLADVNWNEIAERKAEKYPGLIRSIKENE